MKDGICTTWKHYLDLVHPGTPEWWINSVNHRTPLQNEIFLDFDGDNALVGYMSAINNLSKTDEFDGFKAFSNVSHIHLYKNDMFFMTKWKRQEYRLKVIRKFGAEELKKSDRSMIALEECPHWKRGTIKGMVIEKWKKI